MPGIGFERKLTEGLLTGLEPDQQGMASLDTLPLEMLNNIFSFICLENLDLSWVSRRR